MKIVISNAYCYLNKGDAGIIRAMIQEFREQYPQADIKVVSLYKELDTDQYGDCEVIDSIIRPYHGGSRLLRVFRNVLLFCFIWVMNLLRIPATRTIRHFKEADIVVSCGGGYLKARNLAHFLGDFMYHYVQFVTALQYKKQLVIYAQTIGEFGNPFVKSRIRKVLKKSALVLPREPISYKYVRGFLDDTSNVHQTSDVAFLLRKQKLEQGGERFESTKRRVGLTLRTWHFPGSADRHKLLSGYKQAVTETIAHLAKQEDTEVFIMPQCIGPESDNDLFISREIYALFDRTPNVHLVDDNLLPEELKYVYSRMDLFVGTRMHSNIFALSEYVPCVAISYDLKTDGIMEDAGLSDYVIDIKRITSDQLIDRIDHALAHLPEMRGILNERIPAILAKSKLNNTLLYRILELQHPGRSSEARSYLVKKAN